MKESSLSPKVILSFDVELFFGKNAGTIDRCIIEPIEALLALGRRSGIRYTFFIDAGMLEFLWTKAKGNFLCRERDKLAALISRISKDGHDIELHIHPNWIDASWDSGWSLPTVHFAPKDFVANEYAELFADYKKRLEEIAQKKTIAFRAGGFCLPSAEQITQIFRREGIIIDSSVYPGGYECSSTHSYDFRKVPHRGWWRFEGSPLEPKEDGAFYEVPVSSYFFRPIDFLRIFTTRRLGLGNLTAFGDGSSSRMSLKRKLTYAFLGSLAPASVDSGKSSWIGAYHRRVALLGNDLLHVMGHPKAISRVSLEHIEDNLGLKGNLKTVTLSEYWEDLVARNA